MANEFSITTATNTVQLDSNRSAVAAFTAYNASGRRLNCRASIASEPVNQPHSGWLSIDGTTERSFEIGGTEQFAVKITAPADTAPGSYMFRLNLVEMSNPDEGFNLGPSVTFVVDKPPEPEKKFPIWIVPAVIGALLVVGAIIYFATRGPSMVSVPDVTEMSAVDAQAALEKAGLLQRQGSAEFSDSVDIGLVTRTEPIAKTEVEPDTRVDWFLSDGPPPPDAILVPNVVDMNRDEAQDVIEDAGLRQRQGANEFSEDVEAGFVARSEPPADVSVEPNSRIIWFLSDGPKPPPDPLAGFDTSSNSRFEIRHPKEWRYLPSSGETADVLIMTTSDSLFNVFEAALEDESSVPSTVNYEGKALLFGLYVNDMSPSELKELLNDWMTAPSDAEFDWIDFETAEVRIPLDTYSTPSGEGYTAQLRGFNDFAGGLITAQMYVLQLRSGSSVVYTLTAPVDDFESFKESAEIIIQNIEIRP